MATISKDSLAQFWLNTFPISSDTEYLSFSELKNVKNFLELNTEKNEEKKLYEVINCYIQEVQAKKIVKTIPVKTPPKRRRSTRTNLTNIDNTRIRFSVNIEVIENVDCEEEITATLDTQVEDRTIENLSSILNESDSNIISKRFHALIYPWLIDLSFNISNDLFSIIIELMNKYPEEFFQECFIPWINKQSIDDNLNQFFSNLFTQLSNIADQCKLCSYLCENSTCPLNINELSLISKWFDSKEFYFSNDLLNVLPEKISISAKTFSDNLSFAKVLHKILIKCTENNHIITNEQRFILKEAVSINTTILSDILMDLLD